MRELWRVAPEFLEQALQFKAALLLMERRRGDFADARLEIQRLRLVAPGGIERRGHLRLVK